MHRIEREYGTLYNEYTRVKVIKELERVSRAGRARRPGVGWGVGGRRGVWRGGAKRATRTTFTQYAHHMYLYASSMIKYSNL